MTLNKSVAAAIALALASGTAFASTTPADTEILRMAGASATDRTLFETMVDLTKGLCVDSPVDGGGLPTDPSQVADIYTTSATWDPAAPGNFVIYCPGSAQVGGLAGTAIGVAKFSGGSETGIEPVANGTLSYNLGGTTAFVQYADPTSGTCSALNPIARSTVAGADRIAYRVSTGCGKTAAGAPGVVSALAPVAGQSDVNPELFGFGSSGGALTVTPAVVQAFAVVVSQNFYTALQAGLTDAGGNPCSATTAAQSQVDRCIPSLSATQVRSLMSGRFDNVTKILASNGTALTAPAGGSAPRLCSRSKTSGTRASVEITYFGQRCSTTTPVYTLAEERTAVDDSANSCNNIGCTWATTRLGNVFTGGAFTSSSKVFSGSGAGEVEKCLDDANDTGFFALGIVGSDRVPNDGSKQFRFVKIDGSVPNVDNLVGQKFNYYTEAVLVTPSASSANAGLTANRSTIFSSLSTKIKDPTFLPKTHSVNSWGRGGVATRPGLLTAAPAASDTASTRAVNGTIRGTSVSSAVDDCKPAGIPDKTWPLRQ